ncbi:hypothetical protein NPIL_527601 [Nephila pilipes]|uniref:Uncharacterized protein n=1 Tax=Nephila pilipes TaxID=299642 RepID=A0A8X6NVR9_NEPPI|nr:hypothetical protein NPIL_527601 [Nephila pilipes]
MPFEVVVSKLGSQTRRNDAEIIGTSNTDHMVAKKRSQAIWTPRRKAGIRLPAFATKLGYLVTKGIKNLQVKSSFVEKFPE